MYRFSEGRFSSTPEHSLINPETLMSIFKSVHDPDATLGVDQSSSLSLQAAIYTHTGKQILHFIKKYFLEFFTIFENTIFYDSHLLY